MKCPRHIATLLLASSVMLAGCSPARPGSTPTEPSPTFPAVSALTPFPSTAPQASPTQPLPADVGIVVTTDGPARPFRQQLLGTNLPAWIGPDKLNQMSLQERVADLGAGIVRLPGGSWSNYYDWRACEERDETSCNWMWGARPTDFLNFLRSTGQEAMWTVSINGTAQEAAALVAFFNGDIEDETAIGRDVRGRDWLTVGHWAGLRAANGNPEPFRIRLWEVGNEVYGGREGQGKDCTPWGWEDVWTCDGTEYVLGIGSGAERREGYLEFREAMRAVDPEIRVGAVGLPKPEDWGDWGNEVIKAAGEHLDFYVVHLYAYFSEPPGPKDVLAMPQQLWPRMMNDLNNAFDRHLGRRVPVAVTEYNLVAWQSHDNAQLMRRAANMLFVADSIGQMAEHGVEIANQWNLANGIAENGADFGLVDADSFLPNPQYYALMLWHGFGDELLPVTSKFPADRALSVYAGRSADGTISILAINKTSRPITTKVRVSGLSGSLLGLRDVLAAEALESTVVTFNGQPNPTTDLSALPSVELGPIVGDIGQTFDPYSVTLLRLTPAVQR